MSLVRLLGFTTLACGCVVGRYREVATSREVAYIEEKGKSCGSHGHRRNHTVTAERFAAPGDEMERFNYGWSAVHCLAAAMTEPDSAATGTVIREGTVRDYAAEAGFATCTVLPIEHDFWRFYRLDP